MSEVVDMTNCKIGMWTVLYRTSNDTHGKAVWHCRCECGNEKDISGASLRNKSTLSCGCSHRSHNTFDLSGDYAVGYDVIGNIPNINARPHFTYTKTSGCTILGNIPQNDISKIENIFDKGVTFWKHPSEVGNYSVDNTPVYD